MIKTRHSWALLALVLTLVLAACSTPEDLKSGGGLEAQFGSPYDEKGVDVAFVSTGRIYVLFHQANETVDEFGSTHITEGLWLRRLDSNGKIIWNKNVSSIERSCDEYYCYGDFYLDYSLVADPQGNVNILAERHSADGDYWGASTTLEVQKFNASGVSIAGMSLGGGLTEVAELSVDSSGNYYLAYYDFDPQTGDLWEGVEKYSSTGRLQWKRASTVGTPTDTFVTSSGSLFVAGDKGLARYTTSGNLVWTKAIGPLDNVVVSGSSIYTRRWKDIRKFDANGKQLWFKPQSGLNTLVLQDMDGDGSGNVYVSGKYAASTGNMSAMVRKLNSSGAVLWTKTYGTPAYDDALGLATITGSEIYTTGETQGSLAHTNIGGRDAYIRKLNSSGNPLWTK